ncbi:pirin family protein [Asticcacaulis sp.]|uniref:pirin family protein n=1 Tax=Asticcacaulis sp. TaxID=1872648 RepID=UPI002BA6BD16|nr:pirin family protein [Asticcacaulis sp.]HTM82218.1 pirin family protein [Asticcacaulis sp.]
MSSSDSFSGFERGVARISDPATSLTGMPGYKGRRLIDAGDPDFADPFLLMSEDWVPYGAFAVHPHRGIETVTFVIEGVLEHYDSAGHRGAINAGDAQWMTAGRGVLHEENPPPGTTAHALQLWVNLPAASKMTEPRYQDILRNAAPSWRQDGVEVKIFSGAMDGIAAETLNHVPVLMLEVRLQPEAAFQLFLPGSDNAFVFVIEGAVKVGADATAISVGQLGWLTRSEAYGLSQLSLRSTKVPSKLLLFSGPPLGEPVVFGGPFVMNTKEEIRQAFRDFANNRY